LLGTISKHDAPSVLERAIQAFNQIIFQSFRYAPNDTPIVTSNDKSRKQEMKLIARISKKLRLGSKTLEAYNRPKGQKKSIEGLHLLSILLISPKTIFLTNSVEITNMHGCKLLHF
jgi:hypothetical protein